MSSSPLVYGFLCKGISLHFASARCEACVTGVTMLFARVILGGAYEAWGKKNVSTRCDGVLRVLTVCVGCRTWGILHGVVYHKNIAGGERYTKKNLSPPVRSMCNMPTAERDAGHCITKILGASGKQEK